MIVGLTDDTLVPGFPRLGKLRKGSEKQIKNGKEIFGEDLDHFRFTSDREDVMNAYKELYLPEQSTFQFFFPYATVEENFPSWKEAWANVTLLHRCDGVNTVQWYNQQTGKYVLDPENQKPCPGDCKAIGRLIMILPRLWSAGFIGYVTMETHSLNDLINITKVLKKIYQEREEKGFDLRGIEFTLRRVLDQVPTPGWGKNKGKRVRTLKYLCQVEPSVDWARIQLGAAKEVLAITEGDEDHESLASPEKRPPIEMPPSSEEPSEPIEMPPVKEVFKPTKAMQTVHDELSEVFQALIQFDEEKFQPIADRLVETFNTGIISNDDGEAKLTIQHLKADLKKAKELLEGYQKDIELDIEDIRKQVLKAIGSDLVAAAAIKKMDDNQLLLKATELNIEV